MKVFKPAPNVLVKAELKIKGLHHIWPVEAWDFKWRPNTPGSVMGRWHWGNHRRDGLCSFGRQRFVQRNIRAIVPWFHARPRSGLQIGRGRKCWHGDHAPEVIRRIMACFWEEAGSTPHWSPALLLPTPRTFPWPSCLATWAVGSRHEAWRTHGRIVHYFKGMGMSCCEGVEQITFFGWGMVNFRQKVGKIKLCEREGHFLTRKNLQLLARWSLG